MKEETRNSTLGTGRECLERISRPGISLPPGRRLDGQLCDDGPGPAGHATDPELLASPPPWEPVGGVPQAGLPPQGRSSVETLLLRPRERLLLDPDDYAQQLVVAAPRRGTRRVGESTRAGRCVLGRRRQSTMTTMLPAGTWRPSHTAQNGARK